MGLNEFIKIGSNIKAKRKEKGFSQKYIADEVLKIPRSTYSNYENNNRVPDKGTIEKIAKALDVEVSDLLLGKPLNEYYRESAVENMLIDFKILLNKLGYDLSNYGDKYFFSSSDDEIIINKDELIGIHDTVMDYAKFTVDRYYNKLNDDEHKSTLEEINIVDEP